MKSLVAISALMLIVLCTASTASAQTRARTEASKEVILYPDGTWKHVGEAPPAKVADNSFNKPAAAKSLFKTPRGQFGLWYDETKWRLAPAKGEDADSGRASFSLKLGDGFGLIVAEELSIPTNVLKQIALKNAQEAAPDAKIASEEKRVVNGHEVLCLKIEGTVQQIPFIYYGYYYGGKEGTIQVITFTGQNIFNKYQSEFTNFLNGLVMLNDNQAGK